MQYRSILTIVYYYVCAFCISEIKLLKPEEKAEVYNFWEVNQYKKNKIKEKKNYDMMF